jgi:alpha-glucosidase
MCIYKLKRSIKHLYSQEIIAEDEIWWKNCVIYQIYPRSFQDSDGDGVGDLPGIMNRLDYLQELGVDAIWLSPIYPSPMVDFGYDVTDYCDVDPLFGSLETFDQLLASAHDRGLKVILDYVANHTSSEHPWFIESRSSRNNAKRDWYIWRDGRENGESPNNWLSFFGGSAWTWDSPTEQYYLHLFSNKQPDLNWRNPQVVAAMHDALRFWLERGVDGFRMDAVTMLIKHAEMPDMPRADGLLGAELLQKHIYVHNQPEVHDLIRGFRQLFDGYNGRRVIIGETGDLDPTRLVSFYGRNLDEMHLPFNFIPMHMPWQAEVMKQVITAYYAALPPGATPNFVFGNHDISRLATRYGEANHRSVAMLLLTLGGVATLYYGDELGMEDGIVPKEQRQDLMTKDFSGSEPGRDPVRTPMQWSAEVHGSFTASDSAPWLPLTDNYQTVNVVNQARDPKSTLKFYQSLIALRQRLPALRHGSLAIVAGAPEDALIYLRQFNEQRLLIIINFAGTDFTLDLSRLAQRAILQLSSLFTPMEAVNISEVEVKAHESLLLQLD